MSSTIDNRVVQMSFDNKNFEKNVQTSVKTIDGLKKNLNFDSTVNAVKVSFSAMQTIITTALVNVTNQAVNAGKQMVSSLTIQPITTGMDEYETKLNSIQTILANTQKEGTNLATVTDALNELNEYSDKTIYNFQEMTRNIGTFTAAGVSLDTSTEAIKGIANLAAVSGSNAQQASTAMYQLSQALATGRVSLMDWNSVVNAGMGGQVFQDALMETARVHGVAVDDIIAQEGSFRDSLHTGWLSTDILTETLSKFTGDLTEDQLRQMGYTEDQIIGIIKLGETANDAATKVKTVTQLFDTLREAAQSGWAQSWEIVIGNFEEAKELFTEINDVIGGWIGASANARNEVLQGWKDFGGRDVLIDSFKNLFEAISAFVKPISDAFKEIFPPKTANDLYNATVRFKEFTESLKPSEKTIETVTSIFKGLFAAIDIVKMGFSALVEFIKPVFSWIGKLIGGVGNLTGSFGDAIVNLRDFLEEGNIFTKFFESISNTISTIYQYISGLFSGLTDTFKGISNFGETLSNSFSNLDEGMVKTGEVLDKNILTPIKSGLTSLQQSPLFKGFADLLESLKNLAVQIIETVTSLFSAFTEAFKTGDFSVVDGIINTAITTGLGVFVTKFISSLSKPVKAVGSFIDNLADILNGLKETLAAYQTQLKSEALKKIAAAIALLAGALILLSFINAEDLAAASVAILLLFNNLNKTLASITELSTAAKGSVKGIGVVIALSLAVGILSLAMANLALLDPIQLATGLAAVHVMMTGLVNMVKQLTADKKQKLLKGAFQLLLVSKAIDIVATSIVKLGGLEMEALLKGVIGVGIVINMLIFMVQQLSAIEKDINDVSRNLVILSAAIAGLAISVRILAGLSWEDLSKGLLGVMVLLGGLVATIKLLPKNMERMSANLVAVAGALFILSLSMLIIGTMSWETIAKGLITLGGAMGIMAGGLKLMAGSTKGASALIAVSFALLLLVPTIAMLGNMDIATIAVALGTLAAVFTILGVSAKILQPLITTIFMLAGSLALLGLSVTLLGIGILAAGLGVLAFATGLAALAGAGAAAGAAIVSIISGVVGLIPTIIEAIGKGIVLFIQAIANGASAIFDAIKTILLGLIDVVVEIVPAIAEGILATIMGVLEALVDYAPDIVNLLFDFLIDLLEALAQRIPELIVAAVKVLMSFFEGVVQAFNEVDMEVIMEGVKGIGIIIGLMALLATAAVTAPAAILGVLAMGVVIAELALVLAAIGGLAQIPGLVWIVQEGAKLTGAIGETIGALIGGIVSGAMKQIASGLPQIGNDLSSFMTNLKPFLDGIVLIKPDSLNGINSLIDTILALTAANILNSISKWLSGGVSLYGFAVELALFGTQMKAYSDNIKGIDNAAVEASAASAAIIGNMATNLPKRGGVFSWFEGENSLSTFANELKLFGPAIKEYSDSIKGLDSDAVKTSVYAAQALSDMADTLPKQGGVISWFTGINTLSAFAFELEIFGPAMAKYADSIKNLDPEIVKASVYAAQALSDMANTLPNQGGVLSWFVGDNTLGMFAEGLLPFGEGMAAYAEAIGDDFNSNIVTSSASAAKALVALSQDIPNQGGVLSWIMGDNTLAMFGENIEAFGNAMAAYSKTLSDGFSTDVVTSSVNAATALLELSKEIPNSGGVVSWIFGDNDLGTFGDKIKQFGEGMAAYATAIGTDYPSEAVTASTNAADSLIGLAKELPTTGGILGWMFGDKDLGKFGESLKSFGTGMSDYATEIGSDFPEDAVTASASAGKALVELNNALPLTGGVFSWFFGERDLEDFGKSLGFFGEGLKKYADALGPDFKSGMVLSSANAAKALAEIDNHLGHKGGLLQDFFGTTDWEGFSTGIAGLGSAIAEYAAGLGTSDIDYDAVLSSVKAAEALAGIYDHLEAKDGLWQMFAGQKDMGQFALDVGALGNAMAGYSAALSTNTYNETLVTDSANAAKTLASIYDHLLGKSQLFTMFGLTTDMTGFATDIGLLGEAMSSYSAGLSKHGTYKGYSVSTSASAAKTFATIYDELHAKTALFEMFGLGVDMEGFSTDIESLGDAMGKYSKALTAGGATFNSSSVTASADAAKALASIYDHLKGKGGIWEMFDGVDSMEGFSSDLTMLGYAMAGYSRILSEDFDKDAVAASADAAVSLAQVQASLGGENGLLQFFTGEKITIADFGEALTSFANSLTSYSYIVDSIKTENLTGIIQYLTSLTTLQDSLKNHGTGDTLQLFGNKLQLFGGSVSIFHTNVAGVDLEHMNSVVTNMNTIIASLRSLTIIDHDKAISGLEVLKSFAEVIKLFSGIQNVEFDMTAIIDGLSGVSSDLITRLVDAFKLTSTDISAEGATVISYFISGMQRGVTLNATAINGFADSAIQYFTDAISDKETTLTGIGELSSEWYVDGFTSKTKSSKVLMRNNANTLIADFLSVFGEGLNTLKRQGEECIKAFVNGFQSQRILERERLRGYSKDLISYFLSPFSLSTTLSDVSDAGKNIAEECINGLGNAIKDSETKVKNHISTLLSYVSSKFEESKTTLQNKWKNVITTTMVTTEAIKNIAQNGGKRLVEEYSAGISRYMYIAKNKAKELAKETIDAANSALSSRTSVSGIESSLSGITSNSITSSFKSNLMTAIVDSLSFLNNDVVYEPTIRPVLDLSGISAMYRGYMLDLTPAIATNTAMASNGYFNESTNTSTDNSIILNYEQTNISPKPLSRIEIYRDTQRQLSSLKGLIRR